MAKYRYKDRQETNKHGQTLGFAEWSDPIYGIATSKWMGGPSLIYVGGIVCSDGNRRNWFKAAEPDSYFSVPGYVHVKGRKVRGFLTSKECDGETLYHFRETAEDNWRRKIALLHPGDESSHASLLDEDVAQGIVDLCQRREIYLSVESELKLILSYHAVLKVRPEARWEDMSKRWTGGIGEPWQIISDAMDELSAVCPEGYYFGSHPGDGSLFGVWAAEDS